MDHSGNAVGLVADSLEKIIQDEEFQRHFSKKRLTLTTRFHPSTPFNIGAAMGRNELIYALSEYAVVVASELEKGGTWHGARGNLKMKSNGTPLFVYTGETALAGNKNLIEKGGIPLTTEILSSNQSLSDWMREQSTDWSGFKDQNDLQKTLF